MVRIGVEIAFHNIGAANVKAAASFDARHRFEAAFYGGQETACGADFGLHSGVDAETRAAFSGAVAFKDADAVFLRPCLECGVLGFLGAGKEIAQGMKIVGMRFARVAVEKGVSAKHNGALAVVEDFGDYSIVEGGGIEESVDAAHQGEKRSDGKTKAVKHGQGVEEAVVIGNIDGGQHLLDVGHEVGVREFNAFGDAFGAAGEEDDGGFLRIGLEVLKGTAQGLAGERADLRPRTDFLAHVFQKEQLDAGLFQRRDVEFGSLQETF